MSLGLLARAMHYDSPTLSRMVRVMANRGFLTVGQNPLHGRKILIETTEMCIEFCDGNLAAIESEFIAKTQQGMTEKEVLEFQRMLTMYMVNLEAMSSAELPGVPLRAVKPSGGDVKF